MWPWVWGVPGDWEGGKGGKGVLGLRGRLLGCLFVLFILLFLVCFIGVFLFGICNFVYSLLLLVLLVFSLLLGRKE